MAAPKHLGRKQDVGGWLLFGLTTSLVAVLLCGLFTWGAIFVIHHMQVPQAYTTYGCIVVGSSPGSSRPNYVSVWIQSGGGWFLYGERALACDTLPWAPILPERVEFRFPP
jgi:hypothetical protein